MAEKAVSRRVARPFHLEWAKDLMQACAVTDAAVFVKQLGSNPFLKDEKLMLQDQHGGNWDEWLDNMKVRQVPEIFKTLVDIS